MSSKNFPLSITIRAIDKVSGPLHKITQKLQALTAPGALGKTLSRFGNDVREFGGAIGLPKVFEGVKGFGSALGKVGSEVANLGLRLLGLGSFGAFAMFSIVHGAVEAGDKLSELSARTGVAANWIASMQFAAAQLGDVDTESFNSGMERFVKSLGDMKANGGPLLAFLNKVSPKLGEQVRHAKNTSDAFGLMTDAFKRLDDPQKRAALGAAAFGRAAGPGMAEFMHQGRGAIMDQVAEFFHLSGSQEEFAKNSSDLDNAMRRTQMAFLGLRSTAAGALFPALTLLSNAATDFLIKNRDGIAKWAQGAAAAITEWVQSGGVERLVGNISELTSSTLAFIDRIGGFKTVAIGAAAVMAGPLLSALVALVPATYALGAALLTTPIGWFALGAAGIAAAGLLIYKNWEPLKEFFASLWGDLVVKAESAWRMIKPIIEAITTPFGSTQDSDPRLDPRQNGEWATRGPQRPKVDVVRPASSEARVNVAFDNLPPGARVSQESSGAFLSTDVGYSMTVP